jgi:hypothetical protein
VKGIVLLLFLHAVETDALAPLEVATLTFPVGSAISQS